MPMVQPWRGRSISNWFNIRIIIAAYLILGAVYSVASPIFEGPDESNHFFVIQYIHQTGRLPVQDSAISTLYVQEGSQPPLYYLAGAVLISGLDVSAANEYVRSNPQVNIGRPGSPNNKNHYIHTSREDFPYRDTPLAVHLLRGLSIGLGLITISLTYALARLLFPDRKSVALAAAMLVAFNPQFIYMSALVNNDNAINALAAVSLYLLARLWRGDRSWRVLLALAVSLGLAVIAKLGGLILLGFSVAVIGYLALKQRDWRWGVRSVFVVGVGVAVIAGWWFIRNVQLYGDPTGLSAMLKLLEGRTTGVTVAQMISELPSLWFSFWGVFGWFNTQLPDWAFGVYAVVVVGALLSGGLALRRVRGYDWRQLEPILALAGWAGLVFVGLIRYEMMLKAFQGRLLFSAMPALAILLALGVMRWLDRGGTRGLIGLAVVLFAIAAWTPMGVIAPAYAQPLKISLADIPAEVKRINIDFNDTVRLIGGYVEPRAIQTSDFVTIKLYWQALRQPDRDYIVAVRLLGRNLERIGGVDLAPGAGTYPTDLWQAGEVLADQVVLRVRNSARAPARVKVEVRLHESNPKRPVRVTSSDGSEVSELVVVDELHLAGRELNAMPEQATQYRFGEAIDLIGYDAPRLIEGQAAITYRLYWRAAHLPTEDYTLFEHVFDAADALIGQGDSQPFNGDYPTTWWRVGETLVEERLVSVTTGRVPAGATLTFGLYQLGDGARLPVIDAAGQRVQDDQIRLPVK